MRCISCNSPLPDHTRLNPITKQEEDMCNYCLSIVNFPDSLKTKEYQWEGVYEGLRKPPAEYYDNE